MLEIICICKPLITTFMCAVSLLLPTMHLNLLNGNISTNTIFTPVVIFGQFSTGPMEQVFYVACMVNIPGS